MKDLPIFPVESVVMPRGQLPLTIYEPRYLDMVCSCLKQQLGFGVCLIPDDSSNPQATSLAPMHGTLIEIVDWDREDSGSLVLAIKGVQKFRAISTSLNKDGVLVADVELLAVEEKIRLPVEHIELAQLLHKAFEDIGPLHDYIEADFTDAVWVGERLVEFLPMTVEERHELVAIDDPIVRLNALGTILSDSQDAQINHL